MRGYETEHSFVKWVYVFFLADRLWCLSPPLETKTVTVTVDRRETRVIPKT